MRADDEPAPKIHDLVGDALCLGLAERAERLRWRWADVPWGDLDPARAHPALRALVREMAGSEQTTFSATLRLLDAFRDDVDFTQWLSVWLYEETRHPQALLRWLHLLGETVDDDFVRNGRVSSPLPRSRMGALVINVLSEIAAAGAYRALADRSPEPVLAFLARGLAADESRHAGSFYAYARRHLARAADPRRERLEALKVLHAWFRDAGRVTHPVRLMMERAAELPEARSIVERASDEDARIAERLCRTIGRLLNLPIRRPEDIDTAMRDLLSAA